MNYTKTYIRDLTKTQNDVPNIEKLRGHSVLITGATGLVCSAVVDFLLNLNDTQEYAIKVYVAARDREKAKNRFGDRINRPDVVFVEYNAINEIEWDFEVDYIIHGASPANPVLYARQPVETMLANILGINNILDYAKDSETLRILFVSSSEVYGRKDDRKPYGESEYGFVDILNPRACYPVAKRACETLCAAYRAEWNVNSVIVRLGHVYGPTATRADARASSQFFYDVLDGHDIVMKSAGQQIRSYCYIADCVSAMITVLINGEEGKAYNVSNPSAVASIRELADKIAMYSGKSLVFDNPSDEEQRGYNLMDNSSLDATALLNLGWKGLYSIDEGVSNTIRIMRGAN